MIKTITVTSDKIEEITNFCQHENITGLCEYCRMEAVKMLPIHKDLRKSIVDMSLIYDKFQMGFYKEKGTGSLNDNDAAFAPDFMLPYVENMDKMLVYFDDCSEEFIFGVLTNLASHTCLSQIYQNVFYGKFYIHRSELFELDNIEGSKYLQFDDLYFSTTDTEQFIKGWYMFYELAQFLGIELVYDKIVETNYTFDDIKKMNIRDFH